MMTWVETHGKNAVGIDVRDSKQGGGSNRINMTGGSGLQFTPKNQGNGEGLMMRANIASNFVYEVIVCV